MFLLFETASGYGLFERIAGEEIGIDQIQESVQELSRFGKLVTLKSFIPFSSPQNALENANDISEGRGWRSLR
jgi:nucleolar protein 56